jgi:hypothetical protein
VSSRTTGLHNNGALPRDASRPLGRGTAHIAGSLSTAPGSNAAVTTAIAFPTIVSVATMARTTGSASTVSR